MNRRQFLKLASALGAPALVPGAAGGLEPAVATPAAAWIAIPIMVGVAAAPWVGGREPLPYTVPTFGQLRLRPADFERLADDRPALARVLRDARAMIPGTGSAVLEAVVTESGHSIVLREFQE